VVQPLRVVPRVVLHHRRHARGRGGRRCLRGDHALAMRQRRRMPPPRLGAAGCGCMAREE
jgi:hypothetical protein